MDSVKEGVVFLDQPSRSTRGKRMSKLVDDEVEEDDEFWNQDALKEVPLTAVTSIIDGLKKLYIQKLIYLQWIFWVGPFIGAALVALYHQLVIRAIPFKSRS